MTQHPPDDERPDAWLPPPRAAAAYHSAPHAAEPSAAPPRRSGRRWLVVLTATTLALAVAVTGFVLLRGGSSRADPVPSGDLPSAPAVPTPPVVAALERHGLECLDEAYDPWLVKGCQLFADGRIVTVRMKVDATATIEKFIVQVLDGNVSESARNAEFSYLLGLMLEAADVPHADRRDITRSVAADEVREYEQIGWGELYLPAAASTVRTLILTRADVVPSSLIARPILGSYDAVERALTDLGYACREENQASFTCDGKRPGEEFSGAFHNGFVLTLSIWFDGPLPAADAPILRDAYAMLTAVADPHSEGFRQALARMARDAPERVFVANCRIMRWEQRLEVGSVDFA